MRKALLYYKFVFCLLILFLSSCDSPTTKQKIAMRDEFGLLSENERDKLREKIDEIEKRTTTEFCVYIVKSIPTNSDFESYAKEVFNRMELGKKGISNGVLILVSIHDKKLNLNLGFGMEWVINQQTRNRIIGDLKESFSKHSYYKGIDKALTDIDSIQRKYSWDICNNEKGNNTTISCVQRFKLASFFISNDILRVTTANNEKLLVHFTPYMTEIIKHQEIKNSKYIYLRMLDAKQGNLLGFSD